MLIPWPLIMKLGYYWFYCVAEQLKRKDIPTSVFVSSKAFLVLKLFYLSD